MNPSDITPEIIATKIFGWEYVKGRQWNNEKEPDKWVSANGHTFGELPTFLEPEWTGPLLAKAAEIGKYDLYFSGEDFGFWFNRIGGTNTHCNTSLNYAIAGAILEAQGE